MAELSTLGLLSIQRAESPAALRARVSQWRKEGLRVGFVPTMGALHEGHLSLVRAAHEHADRVVASIFVNPTQFGPGEDYGRYPRQVDEDCGRLAEEGCDLIFLPEVEHIYPAGASTAVEVEGPSSGFEADQRPGHFRGVATVVAALFHLVRPDVAVFGEKDAQQLAVVRKMVRDLHFPIEVVGAPIVREPDGLALSSRNVYLSAEERVAAQVLSRSLEGARRAVAEGERDAAEIRRMVGAELAAEPLGMTDYVGVVDADTFQPIERLDASGQVVIPIAYRLGHTRLLDNLRLEMSTF
ncbi:MAG: pantoate--beta-alanine ligase [Acidobacteriota bacterium]